VFRCTPGVYRLDGEGGQTGPVHRWVVAGALIEGEDGLLLVQNRRRGGREDWSTPGGVIDPGETVLGGLAREVREETGLVVTDWEGPVYEIQAEAPDLGWTLRVEVHRAVAYEGDLVVDDPDGIVVDARFVGPTECEELLVGCHRWVGEPLGAWLGGHRDHGLSYRYVVRGRDLHGLEVERTG
jgi:8-oxo-dGTP diphosphatase